jgi:hypothetical protein
MKDICVYSRWRETNEMDDPYAVETGTEKLCAICARKCVKVTDSTRIVFPRTVKKERVFRGFETVQECFTDRSRFLGLYVETWLASNT